MVLHLQRYDLNVTYKHGKELLIADTLSRAYPNEHDDSLYEESLDANVISSLPMSQAKLDQFQTATRESASLTALRDTVLKELSHTGISGMKSFTKMHCYSKVIVLSYQNH